MRPVLLVLGVGAALAAMATFPLSLAIRQLALPGVSAVEATGSLWSGTLRAAQLGGQPFGDVALGLRPLPLLLGRREVDVAAASWTARLSLGARSGVLAFEGPLPPASFAAMGGATLEVSFRQARLLFEDGRCVDAAGSAVAVIQWPGGQLPDLQLAGPVECAGELGRLSLTNADRGPFPIQLLATVSRDGRYMLHAAAQPVDPLARAALLLGGFHVTPSGLGQTLEGRLAP